MTVTLQGLSGGLVARILGVRRAKNSGYIVLGASPLARHLARHLAISGDEVILIDSNADERRAAEAEGFQVLGGNALDSATLARVRPDTRVACIGLTANEDINLEFARKINDEFRGPETYVAIEADTNGVTAEAVLAQHCSRVVRRCPRAARSGSPAGARTASRPHGTRAPVMHPRRRASTPRREPMSCRSCCDATASSSSWTRAFVPRRGDQVEFAVDIEHRTQAKEWLASAGWRAVEPR